MNDKHIVRFWAFVEKTDTCWTWKGKRDRDGYGVGWDGKNGQRAHRMAYSIVHGDIPPKMFVCHHCDNPSCVRPSHLFLGTPIDNVNDMVAKGRQAKGDRCGCRLYPERCRNGIIKYYQNNPDKRLSGDKHWMKKKPELIRKGEESNAKLTAEQVVEIRRKYATRCYSYASLGKEYGVDFTNIYMIVKRKSWKHIQ